MCSVVLAASWLDVSPTGPSHVREAFGRQAGGA
jgi:hypothetical protein